MKNNYNVYTKRFIEKEKNNIHKVFDTQNGIRNQNSQTKGKSLIG